MNCSVYSKYGKNGIFLFTIKLKNTGAGYNQYERSL